MFPTHVGMNRPSRRNTGGFGHVPHTRGDEPRGLGRGILAAGMFPTHVGMNRLTFFGLPVALHVPHTRGDEPGEAVALT